MVKKRTRRGADDDDEADVAAETLRTELARVRARFGLEPDVPIAFLSRAWISPSGTVEEDEAEFVDAVADCISVGLPLGAGLVGLGRTRARGRPRRRRRRQAPLTDRRSSGRRCRAPDGPRRSRGRSGADSRGA